MYKPAQQGQEESPPIASGVIGWMNVSFSSPQLQTLGLYANQYEVILR
jgi:hypothetical protein